MSILLSWTQIQTRLSVWSDNFDYNYFYFYLFGIWTNVTKSALRNT